MWFLLLYLVTAAQAQNWIALRGSDSPCKGRLEVYNGMQWGLVCYHGWANGQSHKNGEVVCKSLGCGEHVKSGHNKDTYREPAPPTTFFMDEVKCNGTESSLWDCKTSRDTPCPADNYVVVECTGSIELQLNKNGKTDECAGVVQFKRKNDVVSVCSTRWDKARADMVCKELNCGTHYKIPKSGTFNKGKDGSSNNVPLSCTGNEKFFRQCIDWNKAKSNICKEEANVICSKYKSSRLKSDPGNVCSGQLEEKDSTRKASWVPVLYENGLNKTADDICSKLNCGKFSNMTQCEESNNTCLTCADKVKVELENKCYGNVYVNLNETRQTVCYDGLSKEELRRMGSVVCRELNCGTLLTVSRGDEGQNGLLSKVDCSGEEKSLWHCLAKYERSQSCSSTIVACTDSLKAQFKDPRDKCAGRVELFYLGEWLPVCVQGADAKTQTTICKSMGCGEVINFTKYGASIAKGLSDITCTTNMSNCDFSHMVARTCDIGHLNCTDWRRLLLTDPDNACSGKVYAWDQKGLTAVSSDGWEAKKGEELCNHLKCGNFRNYSTENNKPSDKSYNCSGTPKTNLDCEVKETSSHFQHLNIICDGNPEVKLLGNCTGEVMINQSLRMCGNLHNTERVLGELCHHLHCRKFITSWTTKVKGETQYFSCSGHENRLWQCNSWKDSCDTVISVACAGGVEFNFTEECGGELQVRYQGKWEPVCLNNIADAHVICRYKGCGKAEYFKNSYEYTDAKMSLKCENERVSDPVDCIKYESCRPSKATIKCEKHVPVVVVVPPNRGLIAGVVVGLLFLLVAIVIVIWQRKRFLTLLRLEPSRGDQDIELSNKEMQDLNDKNRDLSDRKSSVFEIDDYEDIDRIMNAVEDKSKSPDEDENRSTSGDSSRTEYDDVEETGDRPQEPANSSPTEPLLPPRPANLLDDASYQGELDDYDDAVPTRAVVSDAGESSFSESHVADMSVEPSD